MGSSTLKADRLKSHKEPVFPFKSEDWQQLTSQFEGDQAEEVPLTLGKVNFLLHSGLQLIGKGPPTLLLYSSTDSMLISSQTPSHPE